MSVSKKAFDELAEKLRKTEIELHNERQFRLKADAKLERYEKEETDEQDRVATRNYQQEQRFMSEIDWMRSLIEDLVMPKEKLELFLKKREEVRISGPDYSPSPHEMRRLLRNR